jgi:toxin ParE1/3/4
VVRRTPTSRKDFRSIWDHIAADNPTAADAVLMDLDAAVRLLSDHPHGGQRRPEIRARPRSFPAGQFLIYRPIRGGMELLRVVHGARDLRRIFGRQSQV